MFLVLFLLRYDSLYRYSLSHRVLKLLSESVRTTKDYLTHKLLYDVESLRGIGVNVSFTPLEVVKVVNLFLDYGPCARCYSRNLSEFLLLWL